MASKRYAILIASSKYPDEPGLTPLRCPENDVDALNEVLRSPDFGQFAETFVLKNAPSHEVLEQIETVLHEAGREDLVLIYFSGHGKLNASGQLCLAAANTKLRTLGSTSIPVERIKSFFDAADTRQRILILDCCYSGAAGKDFIKGGVDDQLQLMSGGQGTFIMTASTGIQVAVEKEGDSLGLFTKHLVEGIRSGEADRDEDGFVDIHELYQHVYEKVRAEGAQEPMKWDLHAKGKMIVALNPNDAKEKQRQELRAKLYALAGQGLLTDSIVSEAVKLVSMSNQEMSDKDKECSLLVDQLISAKIRSADFIERWMRACYVHPGRTNELSDEEIAWREIQNNGNEENSANKPESEGIERKNELPDEEIIDILYKIQQNGNEESVEAGPGKTQFLVAGLLFGAVVYLLSGSNNKNDVVVDQPKIEMASANTGKVVSTPGSAVSSTPQQGDIIIDSTTGIELIYIPKGCFKMGSPDNEKDRDKDEGPVHEVCVDGFYMGKYEVTQREWKKIMGKNLAYFNKGDEYPVEQVSWHDIQNFIKKLNSKAGKNYRLPTEAEWEYAARAGTSTARYWGDDISCDQAMYGNTKTWGDDICTEYISKKGLTTGSTAPVGSYHENQFGLYDILGNVWELCSDIYAHDWYSSRPDKENNPKNFFDLGEGCVIRGGGWNSKSVRVAERGQAGLDYKSFNMGFRLVLPFQSIKPTFEENTFTFGGK